MSVPYLILMAFACVLILIGGALAFLYGPNAGIPAFVGAGVFAAVALFEAWVREDA